MSRSLTFALLIWATWANHSGHSFVKSDKENHSSRSLKKSKWGKWGSEGFALGQKEGENCQKQHTKLLVLQAICSNYEQITHIALF